MNARVVIDPIVRTHYALRDRGVTMFRGRDSSAISGLASPRPDCFLIHSRPQAALPHQKSAAPQHVRRRLLTPLIVVLVSLMHTVLVGDIVAEPIEATEPHPSPHSSPPPSLSFQHGFQDSSFPGDTLQLAPILDVLIDRGMLDIEVGMREWHLVLAFEDRRNRSPARGLLQTLKGIVETLPPSYPQAPQVSQTQRNPDVARRPLSLVVPPAFIPEPPPFDTLTILLKQQGVDMVALTTTPDGLRALFRDQDGVEEWSREVKITMMSRQAREILTSHPLDLRPYSREAQSDANQTVRAEQAPPLSKDGRLSPSTLRSIDLAYGFGIRYQLGNFGTLSDNYRVALDLEPELRLDLPAGLQARARLAIPLHNNFDDNDVVRPSTFTLSKPFGSPDGLFGIASAGLFARNRAGFHLSAIHLIWEERLLMHLEAGHTWFTPLTGNVDFEVEERREFTVFQFGVTARSIRTQTQASLTYGQFLYYDQGVKLDLSRQFGDGEVGFFALETREGRNGGFRFSIPLFPSRYMNPAPARIRPAERVSIAYRYRGGDFLGREYHTGNAFIENVKSYYPDFILYEMKHNIMHVLAGNE